MIWCIQKDEVVCTTCRKNVQFIVNVDGVKLYCALCAGMEGQVVKLCGWIKLKSNVRVSAIKKHLVVKDRWMSLPLASFGFQLNLLQWRRNWNSCTATIVHVFQVINGLQVPIYYHVSAIYRYSQQHLWECLPHVWTFKANEGQSHQTTATSHQTKNSRRSRELWKLWKQSEWAQGASRHQQCQLDAEPHVCSVCDRPVKDKLNPSLKCVQRSSNITSLRAEWKSFKTTERGYKTSRRSMMQNLSVKIG